MTAFEYFSVMVSVILGLGVTQILGGIGRIVQFKGARFYWVHGLWILMLLAIHFQAWWNIWSLRDTAQFTFLTFLYLLLGPMLLFLAARVLIPDFSDAEEANLEHYYYRVRRTFFALVLLFALWPMAVEPILAREPPELSELAVAGVVVTPILLCVLSGKRWLHAGTAVYSFVMFVLILVVQP